jgi:hypothetical protein
MSFDDPISVFTGGWFTSTGEEPTIEDLFTSGWYSTATGNGYFIYQNSYTDSVGIRISIGNGNLSEFSNINSSGTKVIDSHVFLDKQNTILISSGARVINATIVADKQFSNLLSIGKKLGAATVLFEKQDSILNSIGTRIGPTTITFNKQQSEISGIAFRIGHSIAILDKDYSNLIVNGFKVAVNSCDLSFYAVDINSSGIKISVSDLLVNKFDSQSISTGSKIGETNAIIDVNGIFVDSNGNKVGSAIISLDITNLEIYGIGDKIFTGLGDLEINDISVISNGYKISISNLLLNTEYCELDSNGNKISVSTITLNNDNNAIISDGVRIITSEVNFFYPGSLITSIGGKSYYLLYGGSTLSGNGVRIVEGLGLLNYLDSEVDGYDEEAYSFRFVIPIYFSINDQPFDPFSVFYTVYDPNGNEVRGQVNQKAKRNTVGHYYANFPWIYVDGIKTGQYKIVWVIQQTSMSNKISKSDEFTVSIEAKRICQAPHTATGYDPNTRQPGECNVISNKAFPNSDCCNTAYNSQNTWKPWSVKKTEYEVD